MVVHYPRTVWKNSYAEHKVTGKTYNKNDHLAPYPVTDMLKNVFVGLQAIINNLHNDNILHCYTSVRYDRCPPDFSSQINLECFRI